MPESPEAGHLPVPPQKGAAVPLRFRHVDSLRAVAALLVVWTHLAELLAPISRHHPKSLGFLETLPPSLKFGYAGVIIFFAVSGFVVCHSLNDQREGTSRRFLIKRFCRLYPAFAVSLFSGVFVWWLGGRPMTWPQLAANATMAPGLLGQTPLLGLYWTLQIELVFYFFCLVLYLLGGLKQTRVLSACVILAALLPRIAHKIGLLFGVRYHLPDPTITWTISLAVMFWGAVFRRVYDETGGFRRGAITHAGTWGLALLFLALIDLPDPGIKWAIFDRQALALHPHTVIILPLVVFTLWIAFLRVDHTVLTFLGVISYSLYLFHPVVLYSLLYLIGWHEAAYRPNLPLWVWLLLCTGLSIALASAMYRWVERPGIAFGKRWEGSQRDSRAGGGPPEQKTVTPSAGNGPRFPVGGS